MTLTWSEHLRESRDPEPDLIRRQVAITEDQLTGMPPLHQRLGQAQPYYGVDIASGVCVWGRWP